MNEKKQKCFENCPLVSFVKAENASVKTLIILSIQNFRNERISKETS
jgi:hypothetical protein